ncbi:8975_t:CDS:2, partial [Cetraspora pellucida]
KKNSKKVMIKKKNANMLENDYAKGVDKIYKEKMDYETEEKVNEMYREDIERADYIDKAEFNDKQPKESVKEVRMDSAQLQLLLDKFTKTFEDATVRIIKANTGEKKEEEELYNVDQPNGEKKRGRPPKNSVNNVENQKWKRKRMGSPPPVDNNEMMDPRNDIRVIPSSSKNPGKPRQKRGPSIIDKVEPYNVMRRPPNSKEANLVDPQLEQCTTAAKCYVYIGDEPVVTVLDTGVAVKKITKVNIDIPNVRIPTALQVLESVDETLLLGTDWFQKAWAMLDFDEQKLVIRYMGRRFEVPIMHMDKGKQKECILEELESGDHDEDEANELFDEMEYESEELEEVESFTSNNGPTDNDDDTEEIREKRVEIESPAVCLAVMEEIPTGKKAPIDEKLTVEEQLNEIVESGKVEGKYQENVRELFNKKRELFANGLEELGCTNLVKHVIKTQDAESIKQLPYRLAPNEQEFVCEELEKLKEKGLIKES